MSIPNDLWVKLSENRPRELSASDRDASGLPWDDLANNAPGRANCGWYKAPDYPDHDDAVQEPVWAEQADGTWGWDLQGRPPEPRNLKVSHEEFIDLLMPAEVVQMLLLEKQIGEMSAADFATNATAQATALVFKRFDAASFIELDNPLTVFAVTQVLGPQISLSTDRMTQVLAGLPPT